MVPHLEEHLQEGSDKKIMHIGKLVSVTADEHGCALGTNTPLFAAFQYSLTIQHI